MVMKTQDVNAIFKLTGSVSGMRISQSGRVCVCVCVCVIHIYVDVFYNLSVFATLSLTQYIFLIMIGDRVSVLYFLKSYKE